MAYYVKYNMFIKIGYDKDFTEAWEAFTAEIRLVHDSYGAALFKESKTKYVCFSAWPSKEAWQSFWVNKEQTVQSIVQLKACLEKPSQVISLRLAYTNLDGLKQD